MTNQIEEQAELHESLGINEGDFHELLMAYGKVCEEKGFLSPKAVTIRMDIATHYNDLTSMLNKQKEEWEKEAWMKGWHEGRAAANNPSIEYGYTSSIAHLSSKEKEEQ